jgi:hypothetical protein
MQKVNPMETINSIDLQAVCYCSIDCSLSQPHNLAMDIRFLLSATIWGLSCIKACALIQNRLGSSLIAIQFAVCVLLALYLWNHSKNRAAAIWLLAMAIAMNVWNSLQQPDWPSVTLTFSLLTAMLIFELLAHEP